MSIDPVSATTTVSSLTSGATASTASQEYDSEMFLSLLVAQLQNQDPSSPMDTNEMMSQQVQLASMEQLTELNTAMQEQFALTMRMAASDMVGKQVTYTDASGEIVEGVAESASFAYSVPTLTVGDEQIALDAIMSVTPTGA
ncbi:flagellar hook assembly protein FlgD [Demequina iriomotensis]|uniref:flagellar hook assembly protein FlgD n=1 Tax=Demequina iriomotensis TaxID=1536641 RepID=UPI00078436A0|nr:flagellar hook capping FlgD N-terminal domain-containing protein [Demequina iriomotensis]